jgi:hypothetical protein
MIKTELEYGEAQRAEWEKRIAQGEWIARFLEPVRELHRTERIANVQQQRSAGDRMSATQLAEIGPYLAEISDIDIRREFFQGRPLDQTLQGIVVPLVEDVLERDPEVRSVLNIGAYYAFIDHHLAQRHPGVRFTAMDLIPDMEGFNAEFRLPNLAFRTAYPLAQIEGGAVAPDLAMFSATAGEIRNAELRRYLRALAATCRYVVLSEPIYPLATGAIVDPGSVPLAASVPAFANADYMPHTVGPIAFVHNYRAMLAESGYRVLHYRAYRPAFTYLRWVEVIAERAA